MPKNVGPKSKFMNRLAHLFHLNITCCQFSPRAISNLAKFTSLRSLEIDHSPRMSDEALSGFSALTNLVHLRLRSCAAVTMSGIEKLQTSLKSLDLGQGRLITRENLPSLFAKFPGLVSLALDDCPQVTNEFVMSLPYVLDQASSSSSPSSATTQLSHCPLLSLSLNNCEQLEQMGVNTISPNHFPFLTALSLDHLDSSIPDDLSCLTKLKRLSLRGIADLPPNVGLILAKLEELTYLDVSETSITYDELWRVATLRSLKILDVRACQNVNYKQRDVLTKHLPPHCTLLSDASEDSED